VPLYDYDCPTCGGFSDFAPVAAFADPLPCPGCGTAAPRNLLAGPVLMQGRTAASGPPAAGAARHPAMCGCCGPRPSRLRAEGVGKPG